MHWFGFQHCLYSFTILCSCYHWVRHFGPTCMMFHLKPLNILPVWMLHKFWGRFLKADAHIGYTFACLIYEQIYICARQKHWKAHLWVQSLLFCHKLQFLLQYVTPVYPLNTLCRPHVINGFKDAKIEGPWQEASLFPVRLWWRSILSIQWSQDGRSSWGANWLA